MLYRLSITANFTDIPNGRHNLIVYAYIHDGSQHSSSVDFTINAPPSIAILSIENKTYQTTDSPLSFSVNEPIVWAGYSLDEREDITIAGNGTIINLTNGSHRVTVYANDTAGNMGASQRINFTVDVPASISLHLNSVLTVIFVVSVIAAVLSIVLLLVYLKNHKHKEVEPRFTQHNCKQVNLFEFFPKSTDYWA